MDSWVGLGVWLCSRGNEDWLGLRQRVRRAEGFPTLSSGPRTVEEVGGARGGARGVAL